MLCAALVLGAGSVSAQKTQRKKTTRTTVTKGKNTNTRNTTARRTTTRKKATGKTPAYTNSSIKGLERQRAEIQRKIRQQEQALKANKADVQKRLQELMVLNGEIDSRQKTIEGIQTDIAHIQGNIGILTAQLNTLQAQLKERQARYIKSMRYMARHRRVQDRLMFIFSAKNFTQMYRRLRFVRLYAAYQRAQGEIVKNKQRQVNAKQTQLETVKSSKNVLLQKGKQEHQVLQTKQEEQQKVVKGLEKQQSTIQKIIAEQQKKNAALNAEIDRLVAIEVEKARTRAAAEAARKAAAEEARRKQAEELARKKAEAERRLAENARRIAEAKAREAQLQAQAKAAAEAAEKARREAAQQEQERRDKAQKEAEARAAAAKQAELEQQVKEAEANRKAAERLAEVQTARDNKAIETARKEAEEVQRFSAADRMISGGFEQNKGRLPMPISGNYKIVSHFGQYNVEGLRNVTLDNKGINILGKPGCVARSIYDGEVSAVFGYAGTMVVMVRHGAYISVYCNLRSVSVNKGQKVATGQTLGAVAADNILQFQLRKEQAKLNPEGWLRR